MRDVHTRGTCARKQKNKHVQSGPVTTTVVYASFTDCPDYRNKQDMDKHKHKKKENVSFTYACPCAYFRARSHWDFPALVFVLVLILISQV